MEGQGQQPAAQSVVHQLAKPATKLLAWTGTAVFFAALAAATVRNVREG